MSYTTLEAQMTRIARSLARAAEWKALFALQTIAHRAYMDSLGEPQGVGYTDEPAVPVVAVEAVLWELAYPGAVQTFDTIATDAVLDAALTDGMIEISSDGEVGLSVAGMRFIRAAVDARIAE